eukprot:900748-Pelagomonas_calceolata.AAC.1
MARHSKAIRFCLQVHGKAQQNNPVLAASAMEGVGKEREKNAPAKEAACVQKRFPGEQAIYGLAVVCGKEAYL